MSIYYDIFEIVNLYFFGATVTAGDGTVESLCCTLVSMFGTIFLFSLPFLLVYRFIRVI